MREPDYVEFENNYGDTDDDGNEYICIDGYPKDEGGNEAEGTVIAIVYKTPHGDFVTSWHHNGYRANKTVLELIEDAKERLNENHVDRQYNHCYLITSERAERRNDEYRNTFYSNSKYNIGDSIVLGGIRWFVDEVTR